MGVISLALPLTLAIPAGESRSILLNFGSSSQAGNLASFDFTFAGTSTEPRMLIEMFYSTLFSDEPTITGSSGFNLNANVQRGKTVFPSNSSMYLFTSTTQPNFSPMKALKSWFVEPNGHLSWRAQRWRDYEMIRDDGNVVEWAWRITNPGASSVNCRFTAESLMGISKWWT